jgi:hypothetical protein
MKHIPPSGRPSSSSEKEHDRTAVGLRGHSQIAALFGGKAFRRFPKAHSWPSAVLAKAGLWESWGARRWLATRYFRFECLGLRNRTPSPVPFSSMNLNAAYA